MGVCNKLYSWKFGKVTKNDSERGTRLSNCFKKRITPKHTLIYKPYGKNKNNNNNKIY